MIHHEDEGGVSVDPICGKPVVEDDAEQFEYKRKQYFFCSEKCRAKFERQADRMHATELLRMGTLLSDQKARWGVA